MESFAGELGHWSSLEVVAVGLGIAYVILATRQVIWCWPCAILSTALFSWIFYKQGLYQQAVLQIFYIGMGVYGWRQWLGGGEGGAPLEVSNWPMRRHFILIAATLGLTAVTGWLEATYTATKLPWLDAFTTWSSVAATLLMTRKVLENWVYWFVVDILIVVLTIRSGLPATSVLYAVYVVMAIVGFISWRRSQLRQSVPAPG
jgi:nicotinamide mononucleotide transporter